jgi:hypothetical protein
MGVVLARRLITGGPWRKISPMDNATDQKGHGRVNKELLLLVGLLAYFFGKKVETNPWLSALVFFGFFQLMFLVVTVVPPGPHRASYWPFLLGSVSFSALAFATVFFRLHLWLFFMIALLAVALIVKLNSHLLRASRTQETTSGVE